VIHARARDRDGARVLLTTSAGSVRGAVSFFFVSTDARADTTMDAGMTHKLMAPCS
jgi:hypothetical protein